ncbi:MAG: EAL domain-containing protein [Sulfurisoma sp.]|nr:EAL domain-containing protein [Sulfurisoma sp.]
MIHKPLSSLQVRVTLTVVMLVLVGLWAFALIVADRQESRLRQLLATEQSASLAYIAESLDGVVRLRLDALAQVVPSIPLAQLGDRAALTETLRSRPVLQGLFNSGIIVARPDGNGAFADYPPLPGRGEANFSGLDSFRNALFQGRTTMSKPFLGRFLDKPVIAFATPLYAPDKSVAAVLIGITTLDAPNFLDLVGKRRPAAAGDLLVAAPGHGIFVTGSDPSFMLRPMPSADDHPLVGHIKAGFEGTLVAASPDDGVERLMSVRRVPAADWVVVARLPAKDAFASVRENSRFVFSGAAGLSLLIGFLAAYFLRRALGPLGQAAAMLDAISQGQASLSPLPVRRQDEVGRLMESFNRLQERLTRESAALRDSEAHLNRAQAVAHIGSWHLDLGHKLLHWSPETYRIFGVKPGTPVSYEIFLELVHPDDRDAVDHAWRAAVAGASYDVEHRIVVDDGIKWVQERSELEFDAGGRLLHGVGTVLDITGRKQAEDRLRLAGSVFENTHEGVTIADAAGNILDVNPAFCEITGYSREEVLGRNPRILNSGRQGPEFYEAMWQAILGRGYWRGEIWNRRKDGDIYPEFLTVSAVRDAHGAVSHFVGVFSDITQLKQHERRLERMAHYDALTGVPNRVLLADRMHQAIAQTLRAGHLMAVCYLDLDNFKPVNDTHGHEAGDRLLVEMAQRLKDCLRGGDTVARLGGDEFVLLLPELEQIEECEAVLGRVLEAAARPVIVAGQSVNVSASIGLTLFPFDDADPDTLLRHADQAMYQAKQAGRNRYHLFDAEHDRRARAHHEALGRVEEALRQREFVLHYQPKVDMRLGRVVGAEALIRWLHPERGLLSPGEFLPAIEDTDLIVALGDWVIDTALAQMSVWRAAGLDLEVSVNVAARHLQRDDFVSRLKELLAAHPDTPAEYLELEVLETAALEDMGRVSRVIEECRDLGIGFAIDDFGTGYSSLTYFKALPADTLKIDQSFIRDMLKDPDDLAIVEGIIGLTEVFRRKVIAEGVETVEHGIALLGLGCDLAQGYGIARPMPAADLAGWVQTWRPDPAWAQVGKVRWPREDLQLLVAENDHRRWVDDVAARVEGVGGGEAPQISTHACRFGHWYYGTGQSHHGQLPEFSIIEPIHERIHAVGVQALALCEQGRREEAHPLLPELFRLREELVERLHALQSSVRR